MSNTTNLSEIEKAKLHETTVKISELFIGDTLPPLESSTQDHTLQREKLWLDCALQAGPFESKTYWLSKQLHQGEELLNSAPNKTAFEDDLFPNLTDHRTKQMLSFLTVAQVKNTNSNDYAHEATNILNTIGYTDGLTDPRINSLTLNELIEKLLISSLGEETK